MAAFTTRDSELVFDKAYVHPELTLNDWELLMELDQRTVESREIQRVFSDQGLLIYAEKAKAFYIDDIIKELNDK